MTGAGWTAIATSNPKSDRPEVASRLSDASFPMPNDKLQEKTFDIEQGHLSKDSSELSAYHAQISSATHGRRISGAGLLGDDTTRFCQDKARERAVANVKTLSIILGGWGALIIGCVAFRLGAMAVNLHTTDSWAELTQRHPQTSTQLWTMVGNVLGEACLILWSMSISYMAFRAIVFSKEKVELLTIAAWTELHRAGYTFSRRRPSWPVFTVLVWLGALFLAPGFTTLLTPIPIIYDTQYNSTELDQLSAAFADRTFAGFDDQKMALTETGCTGSAIIYSSSRTGNDSEVFSDPQNIDVAQVCNPGTFDVVGMLQASLANVQTVLGQPKPLFTMAQRNVFIGRTWGVLPLGPNGLSYLNDVDLRRAPANSPTPQGYDYSYELTHQALTANVSCHPTTPDEQRMISSRVGSRPDERVLSVKCPSVNDDPTEVTVLAPGQGTQVPNLAALSCPFVNGSQMSQRTHIVVYEAAYIKVIAPNDTVSTQFDQVQDFTCVYTPYWHLATVSYPSQEKVLDVTASTFLSYADTLNGNIDGPVETTALTDNQTTVRQVLSMTAVTQSLKIINIYNLASSLANSSFSAVQGQGIVSGNAWLVGLENLLYQNPTYNNKSFIITPAVVEASLQGMFDYQSSMGRAFQTAKLRKIRDASSLITPGMSELDQVRLYNSMTLGWGRGTGENDMTSTVVFLSLLPLFLFAVLSWGIAIRAHLKYRTKRGYYGAFDPTDITEAIIAASAGGLMHAFDDRALASTDGLHGARKVKVRLGRVLDTGEPAGKLRLGFVQCD
ncbi:hypothetical protein OC842_004311 [Tilletia horrida]|uniref:Uncharacterized protein n=1 Tax=Tilletia horrida TaxID=155126 RepID=A0AAN6GA27_9BASI|nr:hypothetical protein OC842_004311 [Tilletia horrida]